MDGSGKDVAFDGTVVGGTFVAVAEPAVFVGGGALVITGAMVGVKGRGVLTNPQAARRIVTSKMKPTRLFFIVIFTSNDSIIHAEFIIGLKRVKWTPCHT